MSGRIDKLYNDGTPHDERSVALYEALDAIAVDEDSPLELKAGGDGDIGEELMYLLDIYFEDQDKEKTTK